MSEATPSAASAVTQAARVPAAKVDSRPDTVSARVSARAQGSRVEVEELRSETSTTWVNPDGTMTTEQHQGQIRFKDPAAKDPKTAAWVGVNLGMETKADGTSGPIAHPLRASLAGKSRGAGGVSKLAKGASAAQAATVGTDAVSVDEKSGRTVSLAWPGELPQPVLKGESATYPEVLPGVDFVVHSRRSGFENDVVIKTAEARDALIAKAAGAPVSFSFPLKTKGLSARAEKDGSVSFVDNKSKVVSAFTAPTAWDAKVDPASGNRVNESPVKMTVAQKNPGNATLTVTPDATWLASPDLQFPVTIDPTYATGTSIITSFDTFVSTSWAESTTPHTMTELRVGTYNGGGDVARSYLNFPIAGLQGKDITSASLSLYEFHSFSCTATPVTAYNSGAAGGSTTWGNQPAQLSGTPGSVSVAKGFSSSCAAGRISIPVTAIVDGWSSTGWQNGSLKLSASETNNNGWKKFYSLESGSDPFITYTYNRKPNVASAPTLQAPPAVSAVNPADGLSYIYTSDTTPLFTSQATDPDASKVSVTTEVHTSKTTSSTTLKSTCASAFVASAAPASCASTTVLDDGGLYYARTAVKDDRGLWNGTWSAWTTFRVAAAKPAVPVISCPAPYTNGSWNDTAPTTPVLCTVTATGSGTGAPVKVSVSVDGGTWAATAAGTTTKTVSVPAGAGAHSVQAVALSISAKQSDTVTYGFGYGQAGLSAPTSSPRVSTTGKTTITAAGPPKGVSTVPTAKVRWRVASSGEDESAPFWNDATSANLTVTDNGASGVTVSGWWDTAAETSDATLDSDPAVAGVQATTLNPRVPVLLDAQVCLTYTSGTQCTWSNLTSRPSVMRVPHAFGNGFPTSGAGPGQVALFTGEFNADATDVSVPGYTGDLAISRSHSTYGNAPAVPTDAVTNVFGPGWTASLEGGEAGLAGLQVSDSTRTDGTVAFIDSDGTALVYLAPGAAPRRTGANLTAGRYLPADEDTELSETVLNVTGSGAASTLTLTEADGTKTVFTPSASTTGPATGKDGVFAPSSVTEPGTGATSYTRDTAGRVTRILAPLPPGTVTVTGRVVTCPDGPVTGLDKGCRALRIAYGDATAATGNTPAGQVWRVTAELFNPTATTTKDCANTALSLPVGMVSVPVACYTYDASKRLTKVTDPRTGLSTSYGYGTSNQLTTVTPAGQLAITLNYATLQGRLKLTSVTRPQAAPLSGTATLTRVAYGVPTSGTGLPNLSTAEVGKWAQTKEEAPTYGAAVFGQDYTGTLTQADGSAPVASDWKYADLSYTTADGYTVNTANYGAGDWQRTHIRYNADGNVIRELDAGAIATVIADEVDPDLADLYGTTTVYNAEVKDAAGTNVITPAGVRVDRSYGPIRNAVLADGTTAPARPMTTTTYDQGAPSQTNVETGQTWNLATTETTTAADVTGTAIASQTLSETRTEYGPDATAWKAGLPIKTKTMLAGGTSIDKVTTYDTAGRVVTTRQPTSNGADAGTTKTVYYTADASAAVTACDDKPEWAGLVCQVGPAAAPSAGAAGALTLPTETTTGYSLWLASTVTSEVSGGVTRTSTTTMDIAGRPTKSQTVASPLTGNARPAVFTHYDPNTGQADYTGEVDRGTAAIADAYKTTITDAWGRTTGYRSGTDLTTTAYDTAGRVSTVRDPKGLTTTTWDGADANSKVERRGKPTKVSITRVGFTGAVLEYTGAYGPDGEMTVQTLPGGITQHTSYDTAGEPDAMSYDGQVIPVTPHLNPDGTQATDANGDPVYDQGTPTTGTWMAWTQGNDAAGRVRSDYTGVGSSFDPTSPGVPGIEQVASTGDAIAYDRAYTYDQAGRLTDVKDRAATATGQTLDPGTDPSTSAPCTTRTYTFNNNGARTKRVAATHSDGDCTGTTGVVSKTDTYAYDTADRPTTGANGSGQYTYDALGRQTTLPASDAPDLTKGAITLGYFDDDQPRFVSQGTGATKTDTTFTLDAAGRRITQDTTTGGVTTTTTRHYSDDSDNPSWAQVGTEITRYTESLGGDLAAEIATDGGLVVSLATLHGDVVTTVRVPAAQAANTPATGITGWATYDEYGNTSTPAAVDAVDGNLGYGWLGAKQRSTSSGTAGLTLMGVRFYNGARGLFSSMDPVPGGNDTAYNYPNDPVNQFDLDGRWWGWRKTLRRAAKGTGYLAFGACIVASAGLCAGATALAIGASVAWNGYQKRNGDDRGRRVSWKRTGYNVGVDAFSARFRAVRSVTRYAKHARPAKRFLRMAGRHRGRTFQVTRSFGHVARHQKWRTAGRIGVQSYYGYRANSGQW